MNYALRQLAKSPGFTVVALVTLALALGVNTTAFTVLNRLFFQSLPFRDTSRLVQIWGSTQRAPLMQQSPGDYFDERAQTDVFESVAAYFPGQGSFAEAGEAPVRCGAVRVTSNFFSVIGVMPQKGRDFTLDEEMRQQPVATISHVFWQEHYNSDPNIIGKIAKLDGKAYTIIGVMPPTMDDPLLFGGKPAFWALDATRANLTLRSMTWYSVAARLKAGVSIDQAQAAMTALAQRLAHDFPQTNTGRTFKVVPYPTTPVSGTGAQITWMIAALSAAVLLIACLNIANLQLVRTSRRAQELGIRLALGSSRAALVKMLVLENVILATAGAALGLWVAWFSNEYLSQYLEIDMQLNWRVLAFALVAALIAGSIAGLIPAWLVSKTDLTSSLKAGDRTATTDRSRHWLRQFLVVAQLSVGLTLLAAAGFFVTGINHLSQRDVGWHVDNIVSGMIELDHDHFGEIHDPRSLAMTDKMQTALEAIPGVVTAALGDDTLAYGMPEKPFRLEGEPPPEPGKEMLAETASVSPNFLNVYGLRLLEGRGISDSDRPGSPPVAVVNQAFAKRFWPHESAIGHRIGGTDPQNPNWAEIVGVTADFEGGAEFYNPAPNPYRILIPWAQNNHRFICFSVRTADNPAAYKEPIRRCLGTLAPDIAATEMATMPESRKSLISFFSIVQKILLQISCFGLLLAAVGLYGVIANLAQERRREIGIRMALGQERSSIIWLFFKNGFILVSIGTAIGLALAFLLTHSLRAMIPMLPGAQFGSVLGVALVLVLVASVASWLPAQRNTRVDPGEALR